MASQAQILANRENARHSTGPKTESGKAASKLNAFRHGLTSETLILAPEEMQAFQAFSAALLAELAPVGPLEQQLAQTIVNTDWRINKIPALEANLFALARLEPAPEHIASVAASPAKAALLDAHALVTHERQFRNLHIQEQRLHRVLRQATQQLSALQQSRFQQQEEERFRTALKARKAEAAARPAPAEYPIGSVFSTPKTKDAKPAQASNKSTKAAAA